MIKIPTPEEFEAGMRIPRHNRADDLKYSKALMITNTTDDHLCISAAMTLVVTTWNQLFYRDGPFDWDGVDQCVSDHWPIITEYRARDIFSLDEDDRENVENLYRTFLAAFEIHHKAFRHRKNPVSAAIALHILAPAFFPLWSEKIAKACGCFWKDADDSARDYFDFCLLIKEFAWTIIGYRTDNTPVLDLVDRYLVSKYH